MSIIKNIASNAINGRLRVINNDHLSITSNIHSNIHALYDTDDQYAIDLNEAHIIGYCVSLIDTVERKALIRLASSNLNSARKLQNRIKSDYKDNKIDHISYFNNVVLEC